MPNINIDKLQRPERALLFSTAFIKVEDFSRMGFNALNGLSSFLRYAHDDDTKYLMFQRPERALFISTDAITILATVVGMFQRPKRALFISTVGTPGVYRCKGMFQRPKRALFISTSSLRDMYNANGMFQRPKRALFISTVPSGNPHKRWLSRLIFADICLKILITDHFHSFSGMFTICSYL